MGSLLGTDDREVGRKRAAGVLAFGAVGHFPVANFLGNHGVLEVQLPFHHALVVLVLAKLGLNLVNCLFGEVSLVFLDGFGDLCLKRPFNLVNFFCQWAGVFRVRVRLKAAKGMIAGTRSPRLCCYFLDIPVRSVLFGRLLESGNTHLQFIVKVPADRVVDRIVKFDKFLVSPPSRNKPVCARPPRPWVAGHGWSHFPAIPRVAGR